MISDFVKGKKQFDYPPRIQQGIRLHRAIDSFTDSHESTKLIKEAFRPAYRLYAGAFTDVVYDYFLANDENEFATHEHLLDFTKHTFALLHLRKQWLGDRFGSMFPYMEAQNWLFNYKYHWGIEKSFEGLKRRSLYINETQTAFEIFLRHEEGFKAAYDRFFGSVKNYALQFSED